MAYQCLLLIGLVPGVVRGVVIHVCIIVVQGETMRPRATIIGVGDSEVDCLFTRLAILLALEPHTILALFTYLVKSARLAC